MQRGLTTDMLAAIQAKRLRIRFFYRGEFKTGTVRYWTGRGLKEWTPPNEDAQTWTGWGHMLRLSNLEETTSIKANGISITLAGVTDPQVGLALNEGQRSKTGRIWLALLDDEGDIIDSPRTIFRGRLDGVDLNREESTATVQVTYVHHLQTFETPKTVRYTAQEQRRLYPGDAGLDRIATLQDAFIPWGKIG